jgi:hypothetical protein
MLSHLGLGLSSKLSDWSSARLPLAAVDEQRLIYSSAFNWNWANFVSVVLAGAFSVRGAICSNGN